MSDSITWLSGVERFDANPTATVAVDRGRWETLGATFVEVDDGDDERPGLAAGQVGGLDFGVLDYGEDETFLLVEEETEASHAGVLVLDRDVIDVTGLQPRTADPEVEGRLAALEARMALLETPAGQGADVVAEKLGAYPALATRLLIARAARHADVASGQLRIAGMDTRGMAHKQRIVVNTPSLTRFSGLRISVPRGGDPSPRERDPLPQPEDPSSQVA
jgi:hypothetical protein